MAKGMEYTTFKGDKFTDKDGTMDIRTQTDIEDAWNALKAQEQENGAFDNPYARKIMQNKINASTYKPFAKDGDIKKKGVYWQSEEDKIKDWYNANAERKAADIIDDDYEDNDSWKRDWVNSVGLGTDNTEPVGDKSVEQQQNTPRVDDTGYRGNPDLPHVGLIDQAYNDRMSDYQAERANVEKQRATIDKFLQYDNDLLDRRKEGYEFFQDRAKAGEADNNRQSNWWNVAGILGGPARLFFGEERYNPKTGQMERTLPKSWDELSTNLLRNVGTMASGVQYTGGSGGRGGISFGYNAGVPMALMGYQRQNAYGPYKDWEEIQKKLALDYTQPSFKPWAINNPYPRAIHPFEDEMRGYVSDELAFKNSVDTLNRYAQYYGYEKGSPEYKALESSIMQFSAGFADQLKLYEKNLRDSGLFTDEQINKIMQNVAYKVMGVENLEDKEFAKQVTLGKLEADMQTKRAELLFKAQQLEQAAAKEEREGRVAESQIKLNNAKALREQAEAMEKGRSYGVDKKGRLIPYMADAEGNVIPVPQHTTEQRESSREGLVAMAQQILADPSKATVEQINKWFDLYGGEGGSYLNSNYAIDSAKDLGLLDEKDSLGDITKYGLLPLKNALLDLKQQIEDNQKVQQEYNLFENKPALAGQTKDQAGAQMTDTAKSVEAAATTQAPKEKTFFDLVNDASANLQSNDVVLKKAGKEAKQKLRDHFRGQEFSWYHKAFDKAPAKDIREVAQRNISDNTLRYQIINQAVENIKAKLNEYNSKNVPITPDLVLATAYNYIGQLDETLKDFIDLNTTWGRDIYDVSLAPQSLAEAGFDNNAVNKEIILEIFRQLGIIK